VSRRAPGQAPLCRNRTFRLALRRPDVQIRQMLAFDAPKLVRQLVRALRGKRSQTALSRRLGYRSNVLYTWESGRREPSASELFRIVARTGGSAKEAFASFPVDLGAIDLREADGIAALLAQLRGEAKIADVAARCAVSRYTASRWLSGQTEPRASELLVLVEALTFRAVDLVTALAPPHELPEIAPAWRELKTRREVAFTHPWSQAILRHLETRAYTRLARHRSGWLAQRLRITVAEETESLAALSAAGLVRWDRERWVTEPVAVDTSMASDEERRRLKLHWVDAGRRRIEAKSDGLFSWSVVAVSREDHERMRALHVRYMQALRQIVDASEPSEVVLALNVQLFALE
jgi:transcriptional regulator with XRE-family HTH domain